MRFESRIFFFGDFLPVKRIEPLDGYINRLLLLARRTVISVSS